jgi:alcohol dehydrogenase class IV
MVEPFVFAQLPEIHFGQGKFNKLTGIIKQFGNRVLVVTGKSSFLNSVQGKTFIALLSNESVKYSIVHVSEEPTAAFIDETVKEYSSNVPDVVVSIGGGSVIDAGKAISAMLPLKESIEPYLEGSKPSKQHPGVKVPFIAVPTTSGTGSETTKNAVISKIGTDGYKRSLRHNNFVPNVALVDPMLSLYCPPEITAASGLDAFTQLFEAYLSTNASALTDALAFEGIDNVVKYLVRAYNDGLDIEARIGMSYAAMLSGIVLANAGLGVVHGFASSIGGMYNIPHGVICGSLVGAASVMNINKLLECSSTRVIFHKIDKVGRLFCRETDKSEYYYVISLADAIDKLVKQLKMPKLGTYGVKITDVEQIVANTSLKNNPAYLSKDELAQLLISRI